MIRPGDRLENPVTGEVLVFHRTAAETGGAQLRPRPAAHAARLIELEMRVGFLLQAIKQTNNNQEVIKHA